MDEIEGGLADKLFSFLGENAFVMLGVHARV